MCGLSPGKREALLTLLVGVMLGYSWPPGNPDPNEASRLYLTVALVDEGSIEIHGSARRFGAILDTASFEGRLLSDKAPGASLLGAAVYGLARTITRSEDWTLRELAQLVRRAVMIPLSLLGFVCLRRLLRRLDLRPSTVDVASVGWALGPSAFQYGALFYGHQVVAVCLLGALLSLRPLDAHIESRGRADRYGRLLAAGACTGMAMLTEYQALGAALLLTLYVIAVGRRSTLGPWRAGAAFTLGVLPFGFALGAYHTWAFGSPFELSYHHLTAPHLRAIHEQGIGGVTAPQWEFVGGSLMSLHRGLFVVGPMFLLTVPGLIWLARERRRLALVLAGGFVYFVLFVSSSNMWVAGWGFGPRLLVPVMGWLAVAVAVAVERMDGHWASSGLARGMVGVGIAYQQIVRAVFPVLPDDAERPIPDVIMPLWDAGLVAPNLVSSVTGITGPITLVPLIAAVTVVLGLVVARGSAAPGRRARPFAAALSATVILGFIGALFAQAPAWSEARQRDMVAWVRSL